MTPFIMHWYTYFLLLATDLEREVPFTRLAVIAEEKVQPAPLTVTEDLFFQVEAFESRFTI